jgi:predicted small metal-binding protein
MAAEFECARVAGDNACSVKITGDREHVEQAAYDHVVHTHGMAEGDDVKKQVKDAIWGG